MASKSTKTTAGEVDIYKMFGTDETKEQEGIVLNYSDIFWLRISRAGGSNEHYKKVLTEKLRPYRRAIQTEAITNEMSEKLLREAAAEGLVLAWGSKKYGDGKMPAKTGEAMDFTVDNVVRFFTDLPDIFQDVQEQAGKVSLFRLTEVEADAGN